MAKKKAGIPEGEQQTAAKYLAAQPGKTKRLVVNLDKAKFEQEDTMPKSKNKEDKKAAKDLKKAKKVSREGGSRTRLSDDSKIVVLKKENPYREGTNRALILAAILKAKTVGAAKATKVGKWRVSGTHINRAVEEGIIKIAA